MNRLAILTIFICFLPTGSMAATWHIHADGSGDAPTIQAGIDSAAVGDLVLVGPGTYNEQIDFLGKDIVVQGELGAAVTILDGTGLPGRYGVVFLNGETRAARLEGMTVTGNELGVVCFESEPSVIANTVTENGGGSQMAGILCTGASQGPWSPLIQGNTITNNRATNISGGVGTQNRMIPEILDNYIADNRAEAGDGGGIYIRTQFSGTLIRGNRIENNYAGDHGGGIYVFGLDPVVVEIAENEIWNNVAQGLPETGESGGGIWLEDNNAWVHHNTIVENTGNGPNTTYGGGIAMHKPGTPIIEQNIIVYTTNGGGIFCHTGVTPIIRNNLGWQNLPVEGVGLCADWWQSAGNVIADPLICDLAGGDFSLGAMSPALTHPAGPLGAIPLPGCTPVLTERVTWGQIKALAAPER